MAEDVYSMLVTNADERRFKRSLAEQKTDTSVSPVPPTSNISPNLISRSGFRNANKAKVDAPKVRVIEKDTIAD